MPFTPLTLARPAVDYRSSLAVAEHVTRPNNLAELSGWLLETYVAGDPSAHPPPWLPFCG